jgi:hypothetical protein
VTSALRAVVFADTLAGHVIDGATGIGSGRVGVVGVLSSPQAASRLATTRNEASRETIS